MSAVRTIQDGTLTITDAAGAHTVIATFEGDVSWRVTKNYIPMHDRGTLDHYRPGPQVGAEVSFNILVTDVSNATTATVYDALKQSGYGTNFNSVDTNTDVYWLKVQIDIAEPGPGTEDDQIVFNKCTCTGAEYAEAENGTQFSFTLISLDVSPTVS